MTQPAWGLDITVDISKLKETTTRIEERLGDTELGAWMESELIAYLHQRASNRFASEGDDATGPWDALSSITESIRASQGYAPAHPINVRSGDLRSFMIGDDGNLSAAGGGMQLQYPSDPPTTELRDKLATAQTGRQTPRTVMRPVVALGLTDFNDVMDLLSIYITDGLI